MRKQESVSIQTSDHSSRNKKIAIAAGATVLAGGAIFLASRNVKVQAMSKNIVNSGKSFANNHIKVNSQTKMADVHAAQLKQLKAHRAMVVATKGKDYADLTPAKLLAKHNVSKTEFDRWLTLRERSLSYIYKGPK